MNTSTSRDRLWRKRLNELSAVWPDFVSGGTDGLHKTRVASRRIREALPIVAAAAPADKVKKLNRKMRAITRSLGPIRELDVEIGLLEKKSKTDRMSDPTLEMVRREAQSRRQVLHDELADHSPVGDLDKLLRKLERVGSAGKAGKREEGKGEKGQQLEADDKSEAQWRGVLATRLMRRAKGLATAVEHAGPVYSPERLHEVRISTKKLRYTLEIARDAGVAAALPPVRILKRHQERLGHLHDLQMLLKHVREAEAWPGVDSRFTDLAAYADSIDRECRHLHAGFVEHRAELASLVKDVRHQVVPAIAALPRRQAHVSGSRSSVALGTTLGTSKGRRLAVRPRRAR